MFHPSSSKQRREIKGERRMKGNEGKRRERRERARKVSNSEICQGIRRAMTKRLKK
jgi:hypothetical protein